MIIIILSIVNNITKVIGKLSTIYDNRLADRPTWEYSFSFMRTHFIRTQGLATPKIKNTQRTHRL